LPANNAATLLLPLLLYKQNDGENTGDDEELLSFADVKDVPADVFDDKTESPFKVTNPAAKLLPAAEEESEVQKV
jgi:hypothetical protein